MTKAEANHKLVRILICLIYMYIFILSLQDKLYNHFAMPLIFGRAFNLLQQSLRLSNAHTGAREWCNTLLLPTSILTVFYVAGILLVLEIQQ